MYFVVMPRVNLIVILVMYVRYLYSINCPTVIYLPSMLLFILWRDATSELWTPVQFPLYCYTVLLYSYCLLLLAYCYHFTTRYAKFFVYSKPVRLTPHRKLGAKYLFVLCAGFTLLLGEDTSTSSLSGTLVRSVTKLVSIAFLSFVLSPTGSIQPWFHNLGKTCCCAHHTFSWGSQLVGHLYQHRTITGEWSPSPNPTAELPLFLFPGRRDFVGMRRPR
jgi:hypothetical protein